MMFRFLLFVICYLLFVMPFSVCVEEATPQTESDQQISDFSLSGYGDKGKKSWDLAGKSADIFTEEVKLKDVVGNLYGEQENIKLTADSGDFNKTDGKVHLEKNVVITTDSGAKLTTDSLDWDRKNQLVSTNDLVNIERDNMVTVAKGAKGEPTLKKVALEKDVRVDINPVNPDNKKALAIKEKITITCDGPLEIDYEKNIAVFNNNVKVEKEDATIYSDRMDVYFKAEKKEAPVSSEGSEVKKEPGFMGNSLNKIIAKGNVKIVRGENISYSEEAIYDSIEKKISLSGKPKLIIYSAEDFKNASFGN